MGLFSSNWLLKEVRLYYVVLSTIAIVGRIIGLCLAPRLLRDLLSDIFDLFQERSWTGFVCVIVWWNFVKVAGLVGFQCVFGFHWFEAVGQLNAIFIHKRIGINILIFRHERAFHVGAVPLLNCFIVHWWCYWRSHIPFYYILRSNLLFWYLSVVVCATDLMLRKFIIMIHRALLNFYTVVSPVLVADYSGLIWFNRLLRVEISFLRLCAWKYNRGFTFFC